MAGSVRQRYTDREPGGSGDAPGRGDVDLTVPDEVGPGETFVLTISGMPPGLSGVVTIAPEGGAAIQSGDVRGDAQFNVTAPEQPGTYVVRFSSPPSASCHPRRSQPGWLTAYGPRCVLKASAKESVAPRGRAHRKRRATPWGIGALSP